MQSPKCTVRFMIVVLISLSLVVGCSRGEGDNATKTPLEQPKASEPKEPEVKKTAAKESEKEADMPSGLPTLAEVEGYKQWLKMNREPIEGRTHGRTDIYVNQTREKIASDGELTYPFPDGTVIVKEVLESGLIAIMRKVEGIDPDHNDWQWIEYGSSGSVLGKDNSCWGCHSGAKSKDYVFTDLDAP